MIHHMSLEIMQAEVHRLDGSRSRVKRLRKAASPDPRQVRGKFRRGLRKAFVSWRRVAIGVRVARCAFHSAAPLGRGFCADEGSSAHLHYGGRGSNFS